MTRRSTEKSLFYNEFRPDRARPPAAISAVAARARARTTPPKSSLWYQQLFQTAALVLLTSLLLQPIYAQAESELSPESASTTSVSESGLDTQEPESTQSEQVSTEVVEPVTTETDTPDETTDHHEPDAVEDAAQRDTELTPNEELTASTSDGSAATEDAFSDASSGLAVVDDNQVTGTPASTTAPTIESATSTEDSSAAETATTTVAASDAGSDSDMASTSTPNTMSGTTSTNTTDVVSQVQSPSTETTPVTEMDVTESTPDVDSGAVAGTETDSESAVDVPSSDTATSSTVTDTSATATTSSSTNTASTTEQAEANVVSVTASDAAYQFNDTECTLVEDGSYYCQKAAAVSAQPDDLYAAVDADGDREIYLRRAGVETQITDNLVDDASPYFDPVSNTIVWHRLLNDRFQIVIYEVGSGEETVITDTAVNNMEPSRSGEMTVWQRWVDNNWEIILFDGTEERQLTDSVEHDIAPAIRGSLVIWNVRRSDGTHTLRTYDITSGIYNDIDDPDGVAVANPRMVVVYDAVYENGDIVTRGFDLVTGELIPLQQTPAPLPEDIPEPESTGETRALINQSPAKPEQDDADDDRNSDPDPELAQTASTTQSGTLDLATTSRTTASTSVPTEDQDYTLVIESPTTTSSITNELADVPDVIVPPATTSSSTQN